MVRSALEVFTMVMESDVLDGQMRLHAESVAPFNMPVAIAPNRKHRAHQPRLALNPSAKTSRSVHDMDIVAKSRMNDSNFWCVSCTNCRAAFR